MALYREELLLRLGMIVVLGIDGLGSNVLKAAQHELVAIPRLMARGRYTYHAYSSMRTMSSINWGNHFFGRGADYHNWILNDARPGAMGAVSVFDAVPKSTGCTRIDWISQVLPALLWVESDEKVTSCVLDAVQSRDRDLVVGLWDDVDVAGHKGNFGDQVAALIETDAMLDLVLNSTQPEDHILLIADHGQRHCSWYEVACVEHYGARMEELQTPFVIAGPKVTAPGHIGRPVTHTDTAWYVTKLLNRSVPCEWELGSLDACNNSEWPGLAIDKVVPEEEFRDAISTGVLVVVASLPVLAALALMLVLVRRRCSPSSWSKL